MNALLALIVLGFFPAANTRSSWPLWTSYATHFLQKDGRVVDYDRDQLTTSEGQGYAMFFALVANDPSSFDRSYRWTVRNLAGGDPGHNLPAWSWGRKEDGTWGVKDQNSASDADLWIAYDLIQAGRLWNRHEYTTAGAGLLKLIAAHEVSHRASFPILLPGRMGFEHEDGMIVNPSYMPLFLLEAAARTQPEGPWKSMANSLPTLVRAATVGGFATDWLGIDENGIMTPSAPLDSGKEQAAGSYDAIRVYLWAGIAGAGTPGRDAILESLPGMISYMNGHSLPPEFADGPRGTTRGTGPVSFSAALIPFLQAVQADEAAATQRHRLNSAWSQGSQLYGDPPHYYDQNLAMFALGYTEDRYHIQSNGDLKVSWQR
jgi:endoglucanase